MTTTLPPADERMRAIVKSAPGAAGVGLDTVAVPAVLPGLAQLRVLATGICGTDVHIALDEYAYEAPVVMGHEVLAEVVAVGSAGDAHWIGRRVACETYFSACEVCELCRAGRRNLCRTRRSIGSFENGGFAEFLVIPVLNLHALPDTLGEFDGVLAEPLACITQCLLDPPAVSPGDRVLVSGPGAMGQLAAQVAAASGGQVVLSGLPRDSERLAIARSLGIAVTDGPVEPDSFDVVIECSGSAGGAASAIRAVRRGGRYVQVGIFGRAIEFDLDQVLYKELTVTSGFASTATSWRRAMELIEQGRVTLGPLVTQSVPLDRFSDALDAAVRGDGVKTVVVP